MTFVVPQSADTAMVAWDGWEVFHNVKRCAALRTPKGPITSNQLCALITSNRATPRRVPDPTQSRRQEGERSSRCPTSNREANTRIGETNAAPPANEPQPPLWRWSLTGQIK